MNWMGMAIGLCAFLIIGIFHPIVIKGEYYFTKKVWPVFLVVGIILLIISLKVSNQFVSALLGVTGFASLWSIIELFEQEERVEKGWFPRNPNGK